MAIGKTLPEIVGENRRYWEGRDPHDAATYDAHLRHIAQALDQMPIAERGADYDTESLKKFDITIDTLPRLFVQDARIKLALAQSKSVLPETLRAGGALWSEVVTSLTQCDPIQARYAAGSWQTLVEGVLESAVLGSSAQHSSTLSLEAAATGILRLDRSGGTLTASHIGLVRACLKSGFYAPAKPVLDSQIHSLPFHSISEHDATLDANHDSSNAHVNVASRLTTAITLQDVLEYYLGGAMIYIGMSDWIRATQFLEHVLSTPCSGQGVAHALMLEAYKKWTLTSLLAHGKTKGLPKTANSGSMRTVSSLSKEYECVTEAFKLADGRRLRAEVHEAMNEFREAGNEGLARNVMARHKQLAVSKLADIYSVVPFSIVAQHLGISEQEAAAYVQGLVQQGLVQAKVEQRDGRPILLFIEAGAHKTEQELRAEVVEQTQKIKALSAHVAEVDRRLGISKEYIEHTAKARKQKTPTKDTTDQEEAMDMSFGGPASEEDEESIMADVG